MYKFKNSIFINRSPQEVFDFTSDPANFGQWQSDIESSKWTSNSPYGVGSTFEIVRRFLGRETRVTIEIADWDPPRMKKAIGVSGPFRIEDTATFEAQDDGTLYTVAPQLELSGIFKLAERMAGKQAEKTLASQLPILRRILEISQV